jgi:hypothetical protein
MLTKYILGVLAFVFFALALTGIGRRGATAQPQVRTWLIIGAIFGAVSAWLFYQEVA